MKKLSLIVLFAVSSVAMAKSHYISGIQKVTFRTGPGTDNKIIKMLSTNEKITLVTPGETWAKVKDVNDTEGFVLNRFVTEKVPGIIKYNFIKRKHEKLSEKVKNFGQENRSLKGLIKTLKDELLEVKGQLNDTRTSFSDLKTGSSDYIGLKKTHEQTLEQLKEKTHRVIGLEAQINVYYIKWFLAGGGVLLMGWIIGLISRKKKSYSSLKL